MSTTQGTGLLMVWADVPSDQEAEFHRWYNEEHLAERIAIPGFLSAARYEAVTGGPKHLAIYELQSVEVLESEAYRRVAADPTPWTRRMRPEVVATSFIRNVYTMVHPRALTPAAAASPMAPALEIERVDVPSEIDAAFNDWADTIDVPNHEKRSGVIRGRRYRAVVGTPAYLSLYELEHPRVSASAAWLAPRDASPVSERIRPQIRHAPGSPGLWIKTFELRDTPTLRP